MDIPWCNADGVVTLVSTLVGIELIFSAASLFASPVCSLKSNNYPYFHLDHSTLSDYDPVNTLLAIQCFSSIRTIIETIAC